MDTGKLYDVNGKQFIAEVKYEIETKLQKNARSIRQGTFYSNEPIESIPTISEFILELQDKNPVKITIKGRIKIPDYRATGYKYSFHINE